MTTFWQSQRIGILIQAAFFLSMALQNLFIPRLLGPTSYGLVVALVSVPNLLTGLAEPLFITLFVRYFTSRDTKIAMVLRGVIVAGICAGVVFAVAGLLYGQQFTLAAGKKFPFHHQILVVSLCFFAILNSLLLGIAYTDIDRRRLPLVYLGNAASTTFGLFGLVLYGLTGALALYVGNQIAMALVLLAGEGRSRAHALLRQIWRANGRAQPITIGFISTTVAAAIAPRMMVIFLSVVSVLFAGAVMGPEQLAVFKVGIVLVNGAQYLIPVSAPLLQAYFMTWNGQLQGRKAPFQVFALVGVLGVMIAMPLVIYSTKILALILGPVPAPDPHLVFLLLSIPFYVLVSPLSAVLFALDKERIILAALVLATSSFGFALWFFGIQAAFLISCVAFVAVTLIGPALWKAPRSID